MTAADVRDPRELAEWLRRRVAARAGVAPAAVGLRTPLRELALDSLDLVALLEELEARLERSLDVSLVFDHPDLLALAEALRSGEEAAPAPGALGVEPIAIVALGCRLPGAPDPEALWRLLARGEDAIGAVPPDRWDAEALYDPDPAAPGASYCRHGGFLPRVDAFDPAFFGISPREAAAMDPQQRLLLEVAWETLERAGIPAGELRGSNTGAYVGLVTHDYTQWEEVQLTQLDGLVGTGTSGSVASGRLAYVLGLEGPALTVDTACSSSLVALHLASQALRAGECDLALAGGVTLLLSPTAFVEFSRLRGLAPDGRCKPFSAEADGVGWGEGCALLLLERLADAHRRGHPVLALIRGSALNQDGRSQGLTAPSGRAQQEVIRRALAQAGLEPAAIDACEAHGTGTRLGDPVEATALAAVYGASRAPERPLLLGSVKGNLGHTLAAAGAVGVQKLVLALQHERLPPSLHAQRLSPHVNWKDSGLSLVREAHPWPRGARPRRAGVSAFGISGTNAHLILEEAPVAGSGDSAAGEEPGRSEAERLSQGPPESAPRRAPSAQRTISVLSVDLCGSNSALPGPGERRTRQPPEAESGGPTLLLLSARDEAALAASAGAWSAHLRAHPDVPPADLAHSAAAHRAQLEWRAGVLGATCGELREALDAVAAGRPHPGRLAARPGRVPPGTAPRLAVLFSGQGAQRGGMGRELHAGEPVFRAAFDRCAAALADALPAPLAEVVFAPAGSPAAARLDRTEWTQPALFAFEWSLWELWRSWGLEPDVLGGHSLGELVAATAAGVFEPEDGLRLAAERGRLLGQLPAGGGMAALACDEAAARTALAPFAGRLELAALNAPASCVVSGELAALDALLSSLAAQGVEGRRLPVSHAFHSARVEPAVAAFASFLERIPRRPPRIPLVSQLSGRLDEARWTETAYWVDQLRQPVRFAAGARALHAAGARVFFELGPGATLCALGARTLGAGATWLPALRPGRSELLAVRRAQGELFRRGVPLAWERALPGRFVPVPTYPFQRQRYWLHGAKPVPAGLEATGHPLLGAGTRLASRAELCVGQLALGRPPWLEEHRVRGVPVFPGAAWLELALSQGRRAGSGDVEPCLEGVSFERPLVLEPGAASRVQLLVEPADEEGRRPFAATSRPAGRDAIAQRHVSGLLVRDPPPSPTPCARPAELIEVSVSELYAGLEAAGLSYGPTFRGVRRAWRGEGIAWGEVTLNRGEAGYELHPALLDAAFHLCALVLQPYLAPPRAPKLERRDAEGAEKQRAPLDRREALCATSAHSASLHFDLEDAQTHRAGDSDSDLESRESDLESRESDLESRESVSESALRGSASPRAEPPRRASRVSDDAVGSVETLGRSPAASEDSSEDARSAEPATDSESGSGVRPTPTAWVPFALERFRLRRAGVTSLQVRALRRAGSGDALCLDLTLWDDAGQPVGELEGLRLRRLPTDALAPRARLDWLYRVAWEPVSPAPAPSVLWALLGPARVVPALAKTVDLRPCGSLDEALALAPAGLLVAWETTAPPPDGAHRLAREGLAQLQAWLASNPPPETRLLWLTRGAVAPGEDAHLAAATLWGLARSARSERPDRPIALLDIAGEPGPAALARALAASAHEPELLLRNDELLAPRLARADTHQRLPLPPGPYRLRNRRPGRLDGLALVPAPLPELGPGQVRIRVEAAGLNFRDVLSALDLVPGAAGRLGGEFAGVVRELGPGVTELRVGERVCGLAPGAFAPELVTDARLVAPLPSGLSWREAATIPIAFLSALYGLRELGAVRSGEKVLVHAAAGGVGMAAVQLCRHWGAEVFATASPPKWETLRAQGIDPAHLASSRTTEFAAQFRSVAGGPLDVVLDAFTGERVEAGLSLLGPGGRFLELGKRELLDPAQVAARTGGVRYRAFDLAELDPAQLGRLLHELLELFARGALRPLPARSYPLAAAQEAFRTMANARHIGKLVLVPSRPPRLDGTVLISGGLSGLGREVARHLARRGVPRLLLVSRRGADAPGAAELRAELCALGTDVEIAACDLSQRAAAAELLASVPADRPLVGVVHCAAVLADATLARLSPAGLDRVLRPKLDAAWHLHELSAGQPLTCFLLFSSLAGLLGAPGQASYAAANASLDALARLRRAEGLPAQSLAWGLWTAGGTQRAASSTDRARLARFGLRGLSVEEGLALLDEALLRGGDLVPARLEARAGGTGPLPPLWRALVRHAPAAAARGPRLPARLAERPAQRAAILLETLQAEIAAVLGLSTSADIDPERPLQELGLDSLMALELSSRLAEATGLRLTPALVFDHPTPARLAAALAAQLGTAAPPEPAAEVDADEQEIRRLLERLAPESLRPGGLLDALVGQARARAATQERAPVFRLEREVPGLGTIAIVDLVDLARVDSAAAARARAEVWTLYQELIPAAVREPVAAWEEELERARAEADGPLGPSLLALSAPDGTPWGFAIAFLHPYGERRAVVDLCFLGACAEARADGLAFALVEAALRRAERVTRRAGYVPRALLCEILLAAVPSEAADGAPEGEALLASLLQRELGAGVPILEDRAGRLWRVPHGQPGLEPGAPPLDYLLLLTRIRDERLRRLEAAPGLVTPAGRLRADAAPPRLDPAELSAQLTALLESYRTMPAYDAAQIDALQARARGALARAARVLLVPVADALRLPAAPA